MKSSSHQARGFTLIELVLMLLLLAVMGAIGFNQLSGTDDSIRYERTRQTMEVIRRAMLGDGTTTPLGQRMNFGYIGDWGSLPAALTNLSVAQAPAYAYNSTYFFGAGWKGPYLSPEFTGQNFTTDAWGTAFVWNAGVTPATLTSYGANLVAGGTGLNRDLVMSLPTESWRATAVAGFVADGTRRLAGQTVELRYPVAGVITAVNTVTAASGEFGFFNVPYGHHSIAVTSAPTQGPKPLIVDTNIQQIPNSLLNLYGYGKISYVDGSYVTGGGCGGTHTVCAQIRSTYSIPLTFESLTLWTDQTNIRLGRITINGATRALNPAGCVTAGTSVLVTAAGNVAGAAMTIPANAVVNVRFDFYTAAPACGAVSPALTAGNWIYVTNINFTNLDDLEAFTIFN